MYVLCEQQQEIQAIGVLLPSRIEPVMGTGEMALELGLFARQRTRFLFPVPRWQCANVCNSSPRASNTVMVRREHGT